MEDQAVLKKNTNKFTTKELVLIAMFAAVMAVCSWISIPIGAIPVTLQTFGVFCALSLLGGRNGSFSIAVYILLGAIGLPVFTGFKGGLAALLRDQQAAIYWDLSSWLCCTGQALSFSETSSQ